MKWKMQLATIHTATDQAEGRLCELEDGTFEIIQSEGKKEKKNGKE